MNQYSLFLYPKNRGFPTAPTEIFLIFAEFFASSKCIPNCRSGWKTAIAEQ